MPTENCTLIKGTLGTFDDVEITEDEMLEVYPHLGVCNSPRHEEAHTLYIAKNSNICLIKEREAR